MSEIQDAAELAFYEKAGRWLFTQQCEFCAGAQTLDRIPADSLAEIAFVGRSNVGKSSLVNALTQRKTLARTSQTPGRTRQINFFDLADRLMLVDLPGYGYAKVSKTESRAWNELIMTYLRGRSSLRRVCLLIDGRHGLKDSDREVIELLSKSAVSFQIILTKMDKAKQSDQMAQKVGAEIERIAAAHPDVLETSSEKNIGIAALRAEIATFVSWDEAERAKFTAKNS